jgi:hypothetical protein
LIVEIKPVIDIRNCWKNPDETTLVPGIENVVHDFKGTVKCICPRYDKEREMEYGELRKNVVPTRGDAVVISFENE